MKFEVDTQVTRSAIGDTVTVAIRLHNTGKVAWRAPLWLFIDERNIVASQLGGGAVASSPRPVGNDTIATGLGNSLGKHYGWQMRRVVPDSIVMRVHPGDSSDRQDIRLQVDPSTSDIEIPVRAYVALVDPIPSRPMIPANVRDDVRRELESSQTLIATSDRITGSFARNYLLLHFRSETTLDSKQAAVDLVGGDVVGGYPVSSDGWYLVRLKETISEAGLFDAQARLRALPQVRFVGLFFKDDVRLYVRANDGSNWVRASWRLRAPFKTREGVLV